MTQWVPPRTRIPFDTEDGLRASCQIAIVLHGELDEAQASAYWLEAVLHTAVKKRMKSECFMDIHVWMDQSGRLSEIS